MIIFNIVTVFCETYPQCVCTHLLGYTVVGHLEILFLNAIAFWQFTRFACETGE